MHATVARTAMMTLGRQKPRICDGLGRGVGCEACPPQEVCCVMVGKLGAMFVCMTFNKRQLCRKK